ncbi:hypothetical protein [Sphingobacterium griseoflavum]|uniref:PorV/PorQ family protein n=1 Tax=Sphingobacterium griseoflavum TaxID=1474952 RepID=A0ABQ3HQN3_9SPHI|nr:hypothetical protein [Sphingobacterium griseoflavum]GHE23568.1 hypothetical protein GCM10017764_05360 [Sphingobacterium griseoflavum]
MIIKVLLLLVISFRLSAQQFSPAPFLGAGGAGIAREGVFALHDNPAGITSLKRLAVGSAYQQHFVGTGVASQAFYLAVPFASSHVIGISAVNYGIFDVISLLKAGISFARAFGHRFSSSVSVNYHQFGVQFYESERQFSADLGFQYQMLSRWKIGVFWRNISSASFMPWVDQRIPRQVGLGTLFQLTEEVQAAADIWRENALDWEYRTGITYRFVQPLCIRGGWASNPFRYTAGIGIVKRCWQIDLASTFHPTLGTSPQIAMSYVF